MLGFKNVLSRPFNKCVNCRINLNLVTSKRCIETSANRKEDESNKKTKDNENVNPNEEQKKKALLEQEKMFNEFATDSKLTLEDKQDRFLGILILIFCLFFFFLNSIPFLNLKYPDMLFRFRDQNIYSQRLGDCEFVQGSLKMLKPLGLHRELEVYKQLLSVFPKEKMKTENYYQKLFQFYPKHQETALELLDEMSYNDVIPGKESAIQNTFIF